MALRLLLCCMAAGAACGMFGDQAGVLDRQEHYVGAATRVVKLDGTLAGTTPHSLSIPSSPKLLVLTTEANVVAGVHERTLETAWRFVIPTGETLLCSTVAVATVFAVSSAGPATAVLRVIATGLGSLQQEFRLPAATAGGVSCAVATDGSAASFLLAAGGVTHIVDAVRGTITTVPLPDAASVGETAVSATESAFVVAAASADGLRVYSIPASGSNAPTLITSVTAPGVGSLSVQRLAGTTSSDAGSFVFASANASHVHALRLQLRSQSDIASAVISQESFDVTVAGSGVTVASLAAASDATAGASAVLLFTAHMSDATQRVLGYSDASVAALAAGSVVDVDVDADGEVQSSSVAGSSTRRRWQLLQTARAHVVASMASVGTETAIVVASRDISDSAVQLQVLDGQRDVRFPAPVPSGTIRSLHVLPYARKEGGHASRLLVVCENGVTFLTAATGVLWHRQEARASVQSTLGFDVSARQVTLTDADDDNDEADMSFAARMVDQVRIAQQSWTGALAAGSRVVSDPVGTLIALIAPPARQAGVIAPLAGASTVKLLLQSARVDSCAASTTTWAGVTGVLAATEFDTGAGRWSVDTPVDARVRQEAVAARITSGACPVVKSSLLVSRAHAVAEHPSEVLLVETAPVAQSVVGEHIIALTWINVITGAVTGTAHHVTTAPMESIARTPITQAGTDRAVYALLLRDGTALVAPGSADVISTLGALQGDYTIVRGGDAHVVRAVGLAATSRPVPASTANFSVPTALVDVYERWTYIAGAEDSAAGRIVALHTDASLPHVVFSHDYDAGHVSGASEARARAALTVSEGALSSAVQIRGDDSLLIKHVNPHIVTLVVGLQGSAEVIAADSDALPLGSKAAHAPLMLILLDASSGRVLHSRSHSNAVGPVHVLRHEHWVVYTYWNVRIGRQELAVAAMYDGLIDAQGLTPWKKPRWMAGAGATKSSFGVDMPIVMHRSFILPTTVTSLAVTRTTEGVTVPNLLMTTPSGSVIMLDRRMVDPRRPTAEPNEGEKAEGLIKYSPLLPLRHSWQVTRNVSIPRIGGVASFPSAYESCTLIAVTGVDHFYARASPSRLFDQLDTDFNPAVFIAIVAGLGIVTYVLSIWIRRKDLDAAWQ